MFSKVIYALRLHTFMNHRHVEGDADDADQVRGGNQRAQYGPDTQRLPFTGVDELQQRLEKPQEV